MIRALLLASLIIPAAVGGSAQGTQAAQGKIVGMYVHQHWPYNHPYAARTWTVEDWRGYADGLQRIGFNTILIWPMLETMPDPLTPSDKAYLAKLGKVIDTLHAEFKMRVYIALCPNVGVNSAEASKATFEKRHFFYCDTRVNPADAEAMAKLLAWRERLFRSLKNVDGVAIIDSDPGGWAGSTNQEFVDLLGMHRKMLDRLRPGIELIYWMHAGWEAYSRFYQTGKFAMGTDAEQIDCLRRLIKLNPEPWGLANGLGYARQIGVEQKVIGFNYGRIEGEPSFPLTNFTGLTAFEGGGLPGPRGVMGNAQTHCVQLPNTFAFARGSQGKPITEGDWVQFANDLVPGQGERIHAGWRALGTVDPAALRLAADQLAAIPTAALKPGPLKGLLLGSAPRFRSDLVMMLRQRAAIEEFLVAAPSGPNLKSALGKLIRSASAWQKVHGYQNYWYDPRLHAALAKIEHPAIKDILRLTPEAMPPLEPGQTHFDIVRRNYSRIETYTPKMLGALKKLYSSLR